MEKNATILKQIFLLIFVFSQVYGQRGAPEIIIAEIPSNAAAIRPTSTSQRCMTPNKALGQCIHLLKCQLPEFKKDKLRFLDYFCIIDRVFVGVCCPDSFLYQTNSAQAFYGNPAGFLPAIGNDLAGIAIIEEIPGPPPDNENQGGLQPNRPPQSEQDQEGQKPTGQNTMKKITFEDRRGCGVNQNIFYPRIVGGRPADPKQWPWMVSLLYYLKHFCGGSLITDRHVLTAAHCLTNIAFEKIIARLGEHDLQRAEESRTQDFRVVEAVVHEDYDHSTYHHDIAILKLDRPASFNSYAWPICLPQPDSNFIDKTAIVIGWGKLLYNGPTSNVLMEVSVPVWNTTKCKEYYLQEVWDTNICAGGETGRDSCTGDSGGPLMYQLNSGRWIAIGMVSWGIKCAFDRPSVYTDVTKYVDWILKKSVL